MTVKPVVGNPLWCIRKFCVDCVAGSPKEVAWCSMPECPLWRYRFGRRPTTIAKQKPEMLDPEYVLRVGRDPDLRQHASYAAIRPPESPEEADEVSDDLEGAQRAENDPGIDYSDQEPSL